MYVTILLPSRCPGRQTCANHVSYKAVRRPFDYIITLGGKAFRSQVLFALNHWLQADEESCKTIDEAVAMLHNSSLL
jgi:geranylgeranyl pyrophosphate synthase